MVVKLRLARFGKRHEPLYNIVVAQARSARDSKPLEVIGTYNPRPQKPIGLSDAEARLARPYKDIALDKSRAKYWLGVGSSAEPDCGEAAIYAQPHRTKTYKAYRFHTMKTALSVNTLPDLLKRANRSAIPRVHLSRP